MSDLCQHPTILKVGTCARASVGTYTIPPDYNPPKRHTNTPDLPRPTARLCTQHLSKINAHIAGVHIRGNSHEAGCFICQHPDCKRIEDLWVTWVRDVSELCLEYGFSDSTFYKHAHHFDLWSRKAASINVQRALVLAAQRGFRAGGHSAKTSLMALQLLPKERDGAEKIDVTVNRGELNKMTNDELAALSESIAAKLRGNK